MGPKWDNVGPRRGRTWVDLVRPASGESVALICIGVQIEGVWLHWIDGRTVACIGEEDGCPYHRGVREGELRWKGYFGAVKQVGAEVVFGEVTEDAWQRAHLLRALSDAYALRGVRITLSRRRGGPRRPVVVQLPDLDRVVPRAELLPVCPDVRAAVSVLWECAAPPNGAADNKGEE